MIQDYLLDLVKEFGLTFDERTHNIYYAGKLLWSFADENELHIFLAGWRANNECR